MGSSTMLDVIGSFMVAGILFLMGMRLNTSALETTAAYSANLILQRNLTTVVQLLEFDFKKAGYCKDWNQIPDVSQTMRIADTSTIQFWTDSNNDGIKDSIKYYIGTSGELTTTSNPRDRFLYRQVNNNTPVKWNLGITQFRLRYKDTNQNYLATPVSAANRGSIWEIEINIAVENQNPFDRAYVNASGSDTSKYTVYWRQLRLATKNLQYR